MSVDSTYPLILARRVVSDVLNDQRPPMTLTGQVGLIHLRCSLVADQGQYLNLMWITIALIDFTLSPVGQLISGEEIAYVKSATLG